jgi:creatinine amidohydrolase
MRLQDMTWREVEAYLGRATGIIVPCGSTEQHGPMGLIGTDAFCAEDIALGAARKAGSVVAPALAYTPAPFNMAFPGTISVSADLFRETARQIVEGLAVQGFSRFYFLNGHGANLEPLRAIAPPPGTSLCIRSWWDFEGVNALRREYYGEWEGMHATPSEISITKALRRSIEPSAEAMAPPRKLDRSYILAHDGDRHGPPDEHRRDFPDGRVGSHSALARPDHGHSLLAAAIDAIALDYAEFTLGKST